MKLEQMDSRMKEHFAEDLRFQEKVGESIDKILNNHLAHIEPDVAVIKFQIKILLGAAGCILAAIVGLALK